MGLSVIILLSLVLFLGGGVVLIVVSRRGRRSFPSCGKCRYDMTGSIGSVVRCPECGEHFADVGILPPGGGQRSLALAATGVVLLVIALGCIGTATLSFTLTRAASARRAQAAAVAQQLAAQQAQQTTSTTTSGDAPAEP